LCFLGFWTEMGFGPGNWELFGEGGQHCLTMIAAFDYDKHHQRIQEATNVDYVGLSMGHMPLVLGYHYGDVVSVDAGFAVMVETHTRAALEPNQAPEDMGLMIILPVLVWPHVFGHGAAYGNVICNSAGSTWSEIDSKLDEFAGSVNNGWWAPRGEMGTGIWVCSIETFAWASKLNLALCCGEAAVSRQQMQTLPSPEEMAKLSRTGPDSMAAEGTGPSHVGVSPHLLAALVRFPLLPMTLHACSLFHRLTISVFHVLLPCVQASEKFRLDEQALGFVDIIHTLAANLGGDPKPSSHILAYCTLPERLS
jgi:hypothetical protein